MIQLAVLLAVLLQMFPKDSRFAFLDRPLRKLTTAPQDSVTDGVVTISQSTTESVWTVRNAFIVGLLGLAIFLSIFRGVRANEV